MTTAGHVAYVDPADPGSRTVEQCIDDWWSTRVTMEAVAELGWRVTVLLRTHRSPASFERAGVRYVGVADDRLGIRTALAVRRARPDLIHANGFVFPTRTLVLHALNRSRPVLLQHHGERPEPSDARSAGRQRRLAGVVDAAAFTGARWGAADPWRAARVLSATTPVHDVVESVVLPPGIDRAAARAATGVDGDPAVVWVGRAAPGKDPLGALRAAELAAESHPGLRLWMITPGGSLSSELAAAVERSPLGDRVRVVGPIPRPEVSRWLAAADVFCSTSHAEGSGYALLEALAAGTPHVAVTDLPSHRTILGADGPCGPAAGDPRTMAAVLVSVRRAERSAPPVPDAAEQLVGAYVATLGQFTRS